MLDDDVGVPAPATSGRARERSQREERVSARSGRERGFVPRRQLDEGSGEAAGSCVARMLCSPSSSCLPAWPSQAARWSGGCAGPAGGLARWRQVSFSYFPIFYLFCRFVDILKIPRKLLNFPNCSWPLAGIYTAWNILVWKYLSIQNNLYNLNAQTQILMI